MSGIHTTSLNEIFSSLDNAILLKEKNDQLERARGLRRSARLASIAVLFFGICGTITLTTAAHAYPVTHLLLSSYPLVGSLGLLMPAIFISGCALLVHYATLSLRIAKTSEQFAGDIERAVEKGAMHKQL